MILPLPFAPMEARSVDSIPVGEAWRYEPKWDGFRYLALLQRIHPAQSRIRKLAAETPLRLIMQ